MVVMPCLNKYDIYLLQLYKFTFKQLIRYEETYMPSQLYAVFLNLNIQYQL
jgi:hypothetical protein